MNISIFAKPSFSRRSFYGGSHLYRGSSMVRGEQVAAYIGAKYNPTHGYEDDVCIYIKPLSLSDIKDGSYVDLVDGEHIIGLLQHRPKVRVIACSRPSYGYLKGALKNDIILIPQHHCNFDRTQRDRDEAVTVGIISAHSSLKDLPCPLDYLEKRLKDAGFDLKVDFSYKDREEVVDFYRQIDIQIAWLEKDLWYKNPLKLINAASFGIPTIAHRQVGYEEFEGNYIAADSIGAMIDEATKLKDRAHYESWASKIVAPAEAYHISRIAELYKQLLK